MCMHILKNKNENDILNVKFWTETNSNQEIQNSGLFFGVSWHEHELKKKSERLRILVSAKCELLISLGSVGLGKKKF